MTIKEFTDALDPLAVIYINYDGVRQPLDRNEHGLMYRTYGGFQVKGIELEEDLTVVITLKTIPVVD